MHIQTTINHALYAEITEIFRVVRVRELFSAYFRIRNAT